MQNVWKSYLLEGIVFILLGAAAVAMPGLFTLSLELLVGWLFVIGGIVQGYRTFTTKDSPGFIGSLISAILLLIVGVWMLLFPLKGMFTLTFLLALFYLLDGCAKMLLAVQMKLSQRWTWYMFAGMLEVVIAVLIWHGWPSTAVWVIGLLVGINMLVYGFSQLFFALDLKKA